MLEKKLSQIDRNTKNRVKTTSELNLLYLMCKANEIQAIHQDTFSEYRGIYRDQDVVVIGSGPTVKHYSPFEGAIHIGVNGAYHSDSFMLDYLFMQDFDGEGENGVFYIEEIKDLPCKKFVGQYIKNIANLRMISPQYIADHIGAKTYFVQDYYPGRIQYRMPTNIEFYPVVDNASTIFAALQFALYTHPRRIYIVGCDCSYALGQHFDETQGPSMNFKLVLDNWKRMRDHIKVYFPDIEVISVNPIGLAGMFEDMYTQEYMDAYGIETREEEEIHP